MAETKIVALMGWGFPELAALCEGTGSLRLVGLDDPADLGREIAEADGFVVYNNQYTAEVAETLRRRARRLRWVQFATSGTDNAEAHGLPEDVTLTNAGDAWAPAVAEHAMALLLGLRRALPQLERSRQAGLASTVLPEEGVHRRDGAIHVLVDIVETDVAGSLHLE